MQIRQRRRDTTADTRRVQLSISTRESIEVKRQDTQVPARLCKDAGDLKTSG